MDVWMDGYRIDRYTCTYTHKKKTDYFNMIIVQSLFNVKNIVKGF